MATIVIKDLPESVDLDRQAMLAIAGGARFRGRAGKAERPALRGPRLRVYPVGLAGKPLPDAAGRPAPGSPMK